MSRAIKTPLAERDLIEHYARISLDKIDPAVRFLKVAEESFELLARMPGLGHLWETRNRQLAGIRVYPLPRGYRSYLIFYRPIQDGIEVIRVLYGARDLESVIEGLSS